MRRRMALAALVGLVLWMAVFGLPAPNRRAAAHKSGGKNHLTLLSQVVCGEARGESYEGKVAVAGVILNRVDSKKFPNTVPGIVYQPLAFESVSNGEIYRGVTAECRRAAQDALNGWDPSWGALYFFNPAKTRNKFIWSRPQVRRIGKHVFAR